MEDYFIEALLVTVSSPSSYYGLSDETINHPHHTTTIRVVHVVDLNCSSSLTLCDTSINTSTYAQNASLAAGVLSVDGSVDKGGGFRGWIICCSSLDKCIFTGKAAEDRNYQERKLIV